MGASAAGLKDLNSSVAALEAAASAAAWNPPSWPRPQSPIDAPPAAAPTAQQPPQTPVSQSDSKVPSEAAQTPTITYRMQLKKPIGPPRSPAGSVTVPPNKGAGRSASATT